MIDIPTRLLPPALIGGLGLYIGVTMLWLQPLIESRWAEKELIPRCEANLQHSENKTPLPDNPKRRELEMLLELYKDTDLDKLPFIRNLIKRLELELEAMKPSRLRISDIDKNSICACAVDKAFADSYLQMTAHVASLRTHLPTTIKAIHQTSIANAQSGVCGALPWKG